MVEPFKMDKPSTKQIAAMKAGLGLEGPTLFLTAAREPPRRGAAVAARSAALLERSVALKGYGYLTSRRCGRGMGSGTRPSAYATTWFTRYSAAV